MSLLGILRRFSRSSHASAAVRTVDSNAPDLATKLRQERARIDRYGGEFSLVTFSLRPGEQHSATLRRAADYLATRMRIIDESGWTEDGLLWLLLPKCPADAAATLAREVCEHCSTRHEHVIFDLHHYAAGANGDRRNCCDQSAQHNHRGSDGAHHTSHRIETGTKDPSRPAHRPAEALVARATPLWKRALDVVVATVALIILSPVFLVIAVLIKLTSPGPVLFVQWRAGKSAKPFRMFKFRTMVADAEQLKPTLLKRNEQDGPAFKMEKDPRVTAVGHLLRAASIDELPQLLNVLRGEMSLVGPRPLPVQETAGCAGWHQERLDVTPGLTCLWQVCDRRTKIPFADWMRMDIRYARRRSLRVDLALMLRTIAFIIRRKGT
jgi:lipopolysaccharide/colanic/teichoic acid biosynthesis glycosyltransferase